MEKTQYLMNTLYHLSYRVLIKYCVFSELFKIFRTLFSLCVSVCTHTRPALLQNWQSLENHKFFMEKTQYLMNTLYHLSFHVGQT